MKLFIDANVLIAVCNKEYPQFPFAAAVLSLAGKKNISLHTSPLCLAITFYFAQKKAGQQKAKNKLALLAQNIQLTDHLAEDVKNVAANKKINDFEDGLDYYSAIRNKCNYIITYDVHDFYFSEIPVLTPEQFLQQLKKI